jgi:3-isopropylmalate/(R)-2-methylmalate dehydratase large subunit
VRLVIAKNIEKIYGQNAQNIGLLTSTDFGLVPRIARGEEIPLEEFTRGLDPISADIVARAGCSSTARPACAATSRRPALTTPARPMTLCEKIIAVARRGRPPPTAWASPRWPRATPSSCAPTCASPTSTSPPWPTRSSARPSATTRGSPTPASVYTFRDHLTFLDDVMPAQHVKMGLQATSPAASPSCRRASPAPRA